MTLDDIKADITLVLTQEHERLFRAAGCEPACHACLKTIPVGREFRLATYKDRDVMLCDKCDLAKLARRKQMAARRAAGLNSFGFSRPSMK